MTYRNDTGLVSVTEVFSPYVRFDHINQDVLRAAAERGTLVHDAIADHLDGGFPVLDESVQGYFNAAMKFMENVDEIGIYEERMISEVHQYTGQIDAVVRIKGDSDYTLVDWKTATILNKSYPLQLAAYHHLLKCNNYSYQVRRTMAVRLKKDGTFKVHEVTSVAKHFAIFLNCLTAFRWFNPVKTNLKINWENI